LKSSRCDQPGLFKKNNNPVQKKAYDVFYHGLKNGVMQELQLDACDLFAYKTTGEAI